MIIKPKVSRWLLLVFSVIFVGAVILLFIVKLPLDTRIMILVAVLAAAYLTATRHILRRGSASIVETLQLSPDGEWSVQFAGEQDLRMFTLVSRFVHERLVLLSGKVEGRRWPLNLVLAADAIGAEDFRRLRAALLAPPRNPAA